MGVDFESQLFVGVPLGLVWAVEEEHVSVTKYDVDTGKPYITQVKRRQGWFCSKLFHNDLLLKSYLYEIENLTNLQIGRTYCEERFWILGLPLVKTRVGRNNGIQEVDLDQFAKLHAKVFDALKTYGFDLPEAIGLHLISYISS